VALARMALRVARDALPAYSFRFSRHDFTQQQLCAMLAQSPERVTRQRLIGSWSFGFHPPSPRTRFQSP